MLKAVMALDRPKRITWLRTVITEAAQRELMGNASQAGLDATADDVPNLGATTRTCDAAPSVQKRRGRKPRGES
ncbi:hypothetical protein [Synechococcus sp. PCC 6312]|uniref:hypothetical protein n=1 Tax=Synechococcus sp. (strain ATCC 27167 / PCC 6312) TaxID=195253 RepID=UPI001C0FE545|nr:hypothetical protein [Synechococcus sp. PCC 6312]